MNEGDERLNSREQERALVETIVASGGHLTDAHIEQLLSYCDPQITYHACKFKLGKHEILSELIVKLCANNWSRLRGFKGQCRLSSWLNKIIRNLCIDNLRSEKRLPRVDSFEHEYVAVLPTDEDLPLLRQHTKSDVREALAKLPEGERFILHARYFDGLSFEEIAELLKITINNARVQLHRARERLGMILEQNAHA